MADLFLRGLMNIQKTGWGEIRWQDEKTTILKNRKLQVGEVRLYAGNHQAKHLHYDEQVMYCLAGEAVSAINGEKEILRPGDCRHYPAGVDHEVWNEQEDPFVHLLISCPMNVGADIPFSSRNDMEKNAEFQIQEDMPQGTEGCKVIIITAYDSFSYAQKALRLGACDILAKPIDFDQLKLAIERAVGHQYTENPRLNEVISYIYQHYMEQLEISKLAGLACLSESHLAREFKKEMGQTIISFINKVRIEKSIYYMTVEKIPIKEIMEMVGYQNMNQFYKYFTKETGMTPAAYMKTR